MSGEYTLAIQSLSLCVMESSWLHEWTDRAGALEPLCCMYVTVACHTRSFLIFLQLRASHTTLPSSSIGTACTCTYIVLETEDDLLRKGCLLRAPSRDAATQSAGAADPELEAACKPRNSFPLQGVGRLR